MGIEWLDDDEHKCVSILDQPLFEEPSEEHERQDAYDGPYGVLIGGMALPTKSDLADHYLAAADYLVASVRKQEVEDFTVGNPILFLYRHSVEILIKSLLPDTCKKTHSLVRLVDLYQERVRSEHSCEVPDWILARIEEIAEHDPDSTAFRYSESYDRKLRCYVSVDVEFYISLANIQTVVRALHSALKDAPRFRSGLPLSAGP